jgi:hypothetical protein
MSTLSAEAVMAPIEVVVLRRVSSTMCCGRSAVSMEGLPMAAGLTLFPFEAIPKLKEVDRLSRDVDRLSCGSSNTV